jgi:hypothetical protein
VTLPNAQVEVRDGDEIAGSVFADPAGEWCLKFHLTNPRHEVSARACIANRCSAFSNPVIIFFDGIETAAGLNLELGRYRYADIAEGQPITLDIFVEGGTPPYQGTIDWGSHVVETLTLEPGHTRVNFAYGSAGHYTGIVTATDEAGRTQARYFSVLVVRKPAPSPYTLGIIIFIALVLLSVALLLYYRRKLTASAQHKR